MSRTGVGDSAVAKYTPDDLDRRIIAQLRADGRASLSKLSDALGVARGTVQNRLDRLLETGTLLGFTVRVREDYDVNTVHAVMMIEVVGKSTTQVVRKLRGMPEIFTLHTTNATGIWSPTYGRPISPNSTGSCARCG